MSRRAFSLKELLVVSVVSALLLGWWVQAELEAKTLHNFMMIRERPRITRHLVEGQFVPKEMRQIDVAAETPPLEEETAQIKQETTGDAAMSTS